MSSTRLAAAGGDESVALLFDVSLDEYRRAAQSGQVALRVRRLVRIVEAAEAARREMSRRLESSRDQPAEHRRRAAESPDRSKALAARLDEVDAELARLDRELAWLAWRQRHERARGARVTPDEDGRSAFDREYELIAASEFFDSSWYLARYPDIADAGMDPLLHYVQFGAEEGRDPGPSFSTRAYVLAHRELEGVNPLAHFLTGGTTSAAAAGLAASGNNGSPLHAGRRRGLRLPRPASEAEYLAAVREPSPWVPAVLEVCRREGFVLARPPKHVSIDSTFPAFEAGPDHVIKLYGRWRSGFVKFDREITALRLLSRDPSLPVPRLVADGPLARGWRYLVMTRVPGLRLADVDQWLDREELLRVASWMGSFTRRLHTIELTSEERQAGMATFRQLLDQRLVSLRESLAEKKALPGHLIGQVTDWMPSTGELLRASDRVAMLHGALRLPHVMGHVRDGRFLPTGVIDFNSAFVGHPLWDIAKVWWYSLGGDRGLFEAYLSEAGVSEAASPQFARLALAWALVSTSEAPPRLYGIDEIATLDELASRLFGPG